MTRSVNTKLIVLCIEMYMVV